MTRIHDLAAIADYIMPDIPEKPADLGFVFGTREGVEEFCVATHSLWQRGMFRKLLVSGGATRGKQETEADVIGERLLQLGVPAEVMILEKSATNTGENVIFSRQKLGETIALAEIKSVLVIGKICSLRRYLMTLERHWPGLVTSACPVNYFGVAREHWHTHDVFRARVLAEFEKIPLYLQRDFLRELPDCQASLPTD
ncbi:MAG: YdcF family protein [Telluria sp.]